MKVYKVIFEDSNEWIGISNGVFLDSSFKHDNYKKRNDFNKENGLNQNFLGQEILVNTFDLKNDEKPLFFFIDFIDTLKYIEYCYGKRAFHSKPKYKIIEMDLSIDIVTLCSEVGDYIIEKAFQRFLTLELAISFQQLCDELNKKTITENIDGINYNYFKTDETITIYDEKSDEIINGFEYLNRTGYVSEYEELLKRFIEILGYRFDLLGGLSKNASGYGKVYAMRELMGNEELKANIIKPIIQMIDAHIQTRQSNIKNLKKLN